MPHRDKTAARQYQAAYYAEHSEQKKKERRDRYRNGIGKVVIDNWLLKRHYGIDLAKYDEMLARQDGKCAICKTTDKGKFARFCVDHNHESGEIRSLLCHRCNTMIGLSKESPETLRAAAIYLEMHNADAAV